MIFQKRANNMSEQESNTIRRIIGWGILGLVAVIGVSAVLSLYPAGRGAFFPFHFVWFGGILLIFIIIWAAKWFFWPWRWNHHPYRQYRHQAYDIVKERYARGEITREQFEQIKNDLQRADAND